MTLQRDTVRQLDRKDAFSYVCHRCLRCCHGKQIRVNPYEIARLAANRGTTTTKITAEYTTSAGTQLRRRDDGSCVFLTEDGCGVHPDRPLVCRLYPLARSVGADGAETFTELAPHPRSEGEYGRDGTVGELLEAQAAQPFIDAVDRYLAFFGRLAGAYLTLEGTPPSRAPETADPPPELLDLDRVVERACQERGQPVPYDLESRLEIHIRALDEWLAAPEEEESS